jgi:DNA-directed RNA polymerase subunit RPC12/RpoP
MRNYEKTRSSSGSARTVVVVILCLAAITFSVLNLMRHQRATRNPRENMEMSFICGECGKVFSMSVTEMHKLLGAGSDDILMDGGDVRVKCPDCAGWAVFALQCRACGEYFAAPSSAAEIVCPHCGAKD